MIPNDEGGRRLFLSVLASELHGENPPLVYNAINGNKNNGNNLCVINN